MIIREMRIEDRAAVAQVQISSWRSVYAGVLPGNYLEHGVEADLTAHWQQLEYSSKDVVLVAEGEDGCIQGFIAVWIEAEPYIDNLHVSAQTRSQGLGRSLMREAARRLARQEETSAYLWVAESNTRALSFYQRIGGKAGGRKDIDVFGYPMPAVRIYWEALAPLLED